MLEPDMEAHRELIVLEIPRLRALARRLAGDRSLADDLVQETAIRALTHLNQFQPGTNLHAWLSTILRNTYFNELRLRAHFSDYPDNLLSYAGRHGNQESSLEMRDFQQAYSKLSAAQCEALSLVGASGYSYEDAAKIAGTNVGTMKSRTSRARTQLRRYLESGLSPHEETATSGTKKPLHARAA